jgi:hypothetical protein
MRVNFKLTKDYHHPNGIINKKGSVLLVTRRHATLLKTNGFGDIVAEKEEKEASARKTK